MTIKPEQTRQIQKLLSYPKARSGPAWQLGENYQAKDQGNRVNRDQEDGHSVFVKGPVVRPCEETEAIGHVVCRTFGTQIRTVDGRRRFWQRGMGCKETLVV